MFRIFFICCYGDHRHLHSFPTRRSSDLTHQLDVRSQFPTLQREGVAYLDSAATSQTPEPVLAAMDDYYRHHRASRSEEHTSELQSQFQIVCRPMLEKKKLTKLVYDATQF